MTGLACFLVVCEGCQFFTYLVFKVWSKSGCLEGEKMREILETVLGSVHNIVKNMSVILFFLRNILKVLVLKREYHTDTS